jgi:DNA-binding beta-propeller fold protein YncE
VWVVNFAGNSVTELNTTNGSLVRVIRAKPDGLDSPANIAFSGTRAWVVNFRNNSISEFSATNGSLIRIIK